MVSLILRVYKSMRRVKIVFSECAFHLTTLFLYENMVKSFDFDKKEYRK